MSKIKNVPKNHFPLFVAVRELIEQRAAWLYLLCDEAKKKGLAMADFAPAAIKRCGIGEGRHLIKKGNTNTLKGLKKTLFSWSAQQVFEMDVVNSTDDELELKFHYCPLVSAWQKCGCTDEEISELCDCAMCGDRGIGEAYGAKLDLTQTIANGDDVCHLRYYKER